MTVGLPRLHVVTDDDVLVRPDFISTAGRVLEAGGSGLAFHLRGPHSSGAAVYAMARELAPVAEDTGSLLVVNDRVDVVLAAGLPAVHLGGRSLEPRAVRAIVGREVVVGRSVHDPDEARAAVLGAVDFLVFGNVHETASHPGRAGKGLEALAAVVRRADRVPVLAIGGVSVDRVGAILEEGAYGVAVLGGVWASAAPGRAVEGYISALDR